MARTVGFDVEVGDKGAVAVPARAATALERLAQRLDETGDEAAQAARQIDDLGDEMSGTAGEAGRLAAAIELTQRRHAELLRELDRTGKAELIPQIRDEAGLLRTLTRMRGDLDGIGKGAAGAASEMDKLKAALGAAESVHADLSATLWRTGDRTLIGPIHDAASEVQRLKAEIKSLDSSRATLRGLGDDLKAGFSQLGESVTGGLSGLASIGPTAGAAIAASILPAVGAATSAGVLAGLGGGALAAGIASAARGPEVINSFGVLSDVATRTWNEVGLKFRAPVSDAIRQWTFDLREIDAVGIVAPMASEVRGLAAGVSGAIRELLPGVQAGVSAAVPVVRELARDLPQLGRDAGDLIEGISRGSAGAVAFLQNLTAGVTMLTSTVGPTLGMLGQAYAMADKAGAGGVTGILGDIKALSGDGSTNAKTFGDNWSEAMRKAVDATAAATSTVAGLKDQLDAITQTNVSAVESELRWQESIDAAAQSLRDHGVTLDLDSEKGRANMQSLLGVASATRQSAQATYDQTVTLQGEGAATDAAMARWNAGREQLMAFAQKMGMSAGEAQNLANKIMGIPTFKNVTVNVDIGAALARLEYIRGQIAAIQATGRSVLPGEAAGLYGSMTSAGRSASGGPIFGPGTETSDSVPMMLSTGEHVWTAAEVRAAGGHQAVQALRSAVLGRAPVRGMLAAAPAGGAPAPAAAPVRAVVLESDGSRFGDFVIEVVRSAVDRAGGSAQFALGRAGV